MVWQGMARYGKVWHGTVGLLWYDEVWHGLLPDLEERLDGELDGGGLRLHLLRAVALLQELAHGLGVPPDRVSLPLVVGAAGVGLVQAGRLVVVEPWG